MDYGLAALKLLCGQLKHAKQTSSQLSFSLSGILFQRVWLQGVLVSCSDDSSSFILDDGTGVIQLSISGEFRDRCWEQGMYVMVVGGYIVRQGEDELPTIKVHKIVDLSPYPDREAFWYLEVIEVYRMFYQPLIED